MEGRKSLFGFILSVCRNAAVVAVFRSVSPIGRRLPVGRAVGHVVVAIGDSGIDHCIFRTKVTKIIVTKDDEGKMNGFFRVTFESPRARGRNVTVVNPDFHFPLMSIEEIEKKVKAGNDRDRRLRDFVLSLDSTTNRTQKVLKRIGIKRLRGLNLYASVNNKNGRIIVGDEDMLAAKMAQKRARFGRRDGSYFPE